jgi:hypothetical protein
MEDSQRLATASPRNKTFGEARLNCEASTGIDGYNSLGEPSWLLRDARRARQALLDFVYQ